MVDSNRSDTEDGDMDKLQLSSDSIDTILSRKRLRVEDSEDETDLSAKRCQNSFGEQSVMIKNDNVKTTSEKNNMERCCNIKEERYTLCLEDEQTVQEMSSKSEINNKNKEKQDGKLKQENGNECPPLENDIALNNGPGDKKEIVQNKKPANVNIMSALENQKVRMRDNEVVEEIIDETINGRKDNENDEEKRKQRTVKRRTVDTEVIDGLELSVECASDKDESSSGSKDEEDVKPRPKTIIVKAEPNESELDCSSNEEKSDLQQAVVDTKCEIKSEKSKVKRRSSRTGFNKLKAFDSEDSQNNNSDEDYSPRTKRKIKKSSPMMNRTMNKRSIEAKKGQGRGRKRNFHKKNAEYISDEDENATVIERENKTIKTKNRMEEKLSEKESSSKDESDNNSEKREKLKGRKRRRSNAKPEDKHIQALKKYLSIAGIKVKSYNDIWDDCKSNAAKIKRLKELLEKNGVSGRPTLEKCKRVREKNEKMREVSELDISNIISEGRVTRARRNMENIKKTPPNTPPRHREARNTFRRIQTVIDSDSE